MSENLLEGVRHLKQSTIRIQRDRTIYFDPFGIEGKPKDADIIMISHSHYDHFSLKDIKKLVKENTLLVLPEDCVKDAEEAGYTNVFTVVPSKKYEIEGLKFSTVPAYNMNKRFHRKESKWVGYIVNIDHADYYFAGDTDLIPEMKDIRADVVFLPVGGTYTMTSAEAVEAANIICPKIAVPIHFADVVGNRADAEHFVKEIDPSIQGVILK